MVRSEECGAGEPERGINGIEDSAGEALAVLATMVTCSRLGLNPKFATQVSFDFVSCSGIVEDSAVSRDYETCDAEPRTA